GHPSIFVYRTQTDEIIELRPKGRIIGCFPDTASQTVEFPLRTNDIIIAYTDGITEARNPDGEMFGEEAFIAAIRSASGQKTSKIRDTIIERVNSFRGKNETVEDDITLLVCRVIPE
ncbi:MAG TPA: PP2C family protein-serine/threonine phosphatase, partial [Spirochaetota bacterium]|nr:PP2C family protein-serine/threonine phosphatase [Spirochaetota bacterium]